MIDKIRDEIKSRYEIARKKFLTTEGDSQILYEGRASAFVGILRFLDTLESEPGQRDSEKPNLFEELGDAAEEHAINSFTYRFPTADKSIIRSDLLYSFRAGAKWAMEQGETYEGRVIKNGLSGYLVVQHTVKSFEPDEKVIIQIRKRP